MLWLSMSQGKGSAKASKGTHKDGWCVDFDLRIGAWSVENLTQVCAELEARHQFACGPRHKGEEGPGVPSHLHIAFHGRANYALILAARAVKSLAARIRAAIETR